MVMPGDNVTMEVELIHPIAIENGTKFSIRERGRTVGAGVVTLPEGTEMVMPGDNVTMEVELIHPIAIENGTKFSIRERGRTVGAGVVTEIKA